MPLPRTKEKPILLRIPENYISVLDYIVKGSKGKFRSRNDLVTEIIDVFLSDLKNIAELRKKKK